MVMLLHIAILHHRGHTSSHTDTNANPGPRRTTGKVGVKHYLTGARLVDHVALVLGVAPVVVPVNKMPVLLGLRGELPIIKRTGGWLVGGWGCCCIAVVSSVGTSIELVFAAVPHVRSRSADIVRHGVLGVVLGVANEPGVVVVWCRCCHCCHW